MSKALGIEFPREAIRFSRVAINARWHPVVWLMRPARHPRVEMICLPRAPFPDLPVVVKGKADPAIETPTARAIVNPVDVVVGVRHGDTVSPFFALSNVRIVRRRQASAPMSSYARDCQTRGLRRA